MREIRSQQSRDALAAAIQAEESRLAPLNARARVFGSATTPTPYPVLLLADQHTDNAGATDVSNVQLPAAVPLQRFGASVLAAFAYAIVPAGSDLIRVHGQTTTPATGFLTSADLGANILLVCRAPGLWVAESVVGIWSVR